MGFFFFQNLAPDLWEHPYGRICLLSASISAKTSTQSYPPGLRVSRRTDYQQVLDTRQILVLSSVSVGCPSKPCYRIGDRQLAQLAFGKPAGTSHGTSFTLILPDKPEDLLVLLQQRRRLWHINLNMMVSRKTQMTLSIQLTEKKIA